MTAPIYIAPGSAGPIDVPYLTTDEYINDPDAVDWSNLVPGGTLTQNTDALFQKILEASSWMDSFCHYALGATVDIEVQRCRVRVDGTVQFATRGFPIQEIESIKIGRIPSQMVAINAANYPDIYAEENLIVIPAIVSTSATSSFGPGDRVYVQVTYVNGFPNTITRVASLVNDTNLLVKSSLAIYPGTSLTIFDLAKTEVITVAPSYVGGLGSSTTIPLTSGLVYAHGVGVAASGLTANAKKAAKLATSAFIRTRGNGAMQMNGITSDNPTGDVSGESGGLQDLRLAADLLKSFQNNFFA